MKVIGIFLEIKKLSNTNYEIDKLQNLISKN